MPLLTVILSKNMRTKKLLPSLEQWQDSSDVAMAQKRSVGMLREVLYEDESGIASAWRSS